jgi:NitT/TauT family transport system ATP-binding protein
VNAEAGKTLAREPAATDRGGSEVALRDVSFAYGSHQPGEVQAGWAVRHIDLEIERGDLVVIVGPSGCGKTTLLSLIGGLLTPTAGVVQVAGGEPARERRRMGWMPARHGLLPWRTALGNVVLTLEAGRSKLSRRERLERGRELIGKLGLTGYEEYYPEQLSQGMRQRVSLARALVSDPELLLLDEPFGALDAHTKLRVQNEFLAAWEGSGRTAVFITHDVQEAVLLADRLIVMQGQPGGIVFDRRVDIPRPRAGRLQELFISAGFRDVYHQLIELVTDDDTDWDAAPTVPRARP